MNNAIFPNKFKAALAAQQVQIGCWSALASPITTEVLGLAGFDWLVLDGEHAPNDVTTLIPQLMALKGSASAPVVRVPTFIVIAFSLSIPGLFFKGVGKLLRAGAECA